MVYQSTLHNRNTMVLLTADEELYNINLQNLNKTSYKINYNRFIFRDIMQPINHFLHHTRLFDMKILLENQGIAFFLAYKSNSSQWKGFFTYDELPKTLTNSVKTLQDLLSLFESSENFTVSESGVITIVLRDLIKNKII